MRVFGILVVVVSLLVPFAFGPTPAQAQQDEANSITLTEAFLTMKLLTAQRPNAALVDLTFDFQPGVIVLTGTTNGDQQPLEVSFSLVPTVANGRLSVDLTAMSIGGRTIDLQDGSQYSPTATTSAVQTLLGDTVPSNRIESVTVTDDALTFTWLRSDPGAPTLAFVDNTLTMTATEDYINALPGMVTPANPEFASFNIDFRPGQAVLTTTYTASDGIPYPVEITYTPTIVNGLATWSVQAMIVGGNQFDALAIGQINDDIVTSWRMFFNGLYRSGQLVSIELTDEAISLTWDADLNTPIAFDPDAGPLYITETFINEQLTLTKPDTYVISNVKIDLQPGQAVLSANLNLPSGTVYVEEITFIPSVENGYIQWVVGNVTLNGDPVDDVTLARFNETMTQAWNTTLWSNTSAYRITSVLIDDTQMQLTVRPR